MLLFWPFTEFQDENKTFEAWSLLSDHISSKKKDLHLDEKSTDVISDKNFVSSTVCVEKEDVLIRLGSSQYTDRPVYRWIVFREYSMTSDWLPIRFLDLFVSLSMQFGRQPETITETMTEILSSR